MQPLTEHEFDELQDLLDRVPAPFEPLDLCALDGYLCGVLLQPQRQSVGRWWPHVVDVDGRSVASSAPMERLRGLVLRRHAELDAAITKRQWFDPWVFELAEAAGDEPGGAEDVEADLDPDRDDDDDDDDTPATVDAVLPWVAGFATAMECFPGLMALDADALTEPLALLYRHLSPDDLEDAEALLAEIESLEPPQDLPEAVEGLVRATLLLADVSRPVGAAAPPSGHRPPAGSRSPGSTPPRRGRS